MVDIIKVSAKSRSTAVAGAIAGVIREVHHVEVQAIGAGAVNQAVKAVAIARSYLEQDGLDIFCIPTFAEVEINGEERTAVKLHVEVSNRNGQLPSQPVQTNIPTAAPEDIENI